MSNPRYVDIHILRSTCEPCNLDTMRTFVLGDNENPRMAFAQMERWVKQRWPKDHGCTHRIQFRWETDRQYKFDTKTKEAVKR